MALPIGQAEVSPEDPPQRPTHGKRWAELLARVFGLELQRCPDCGGTLKIIAAILEPFAIQNILTYLGLPDKTPELAPARIPTQILLHTPGGERLTGGAHFA